MAKILIVEDEKILSEMYVDKFLRSGFIVVFARNASEGYLAAKKEKPDLILLDILLPDGTGLDMLKTLRKDPEIGQTAVIVFSNFDDPPTKRKALSLGVKEYLIKTAYTPQRIIDKIKTYLPR